MHGTAYGMASAWAKLKGHSNEQLVPQLQPQDCTSRGCDSRCFVPADNKHEAKGAAVLLVGDQAGNVATVNSQIRQDP